MGRLCIAVALIVCANAKQQFRASRRTWTATKAHSTVDYDPYEFDGITYWREGNYWYTKYDAQGNAAPTGKVYECKWAGEAPFCRGDCGDGRGAFCGGADGATCSYLGEQRGEPDTYGDGYTCDTSLFYFDHRIPKDQRKLKTYQSSKVFCCNLIDSCRWEGKAPFCGGYCQGFWTKHNETKRVEDEADYGSGCWTGHKEHCCLDESKLLSIKPTNGTWSKSPRGSSSRVIGMSRRHINDGP